MTQDANNAAIAAMLDCVPVSAAAKGELVRRMTAADRHYHDLNHLATLWGRHRAYCAGTGLDEPEVEGRLAAAILWHDAVYVPGRADNEQASAALWRQAAASSRLPDSLVDWVACAIVATSDHIGARPSGSGCEDKALQWLLDLDLSPLGEPPDLFARNTALLALEYAVAAIDWKSGRETFLSRVDACQSIYLSAPLAQAFEHQARANIARVLGASQRDDGDQQPVSR